jgi:hypothetical protein
LAPGWRTGANCDQYPRGDRRLGEAGTNLGQHTIEALGCLFVRRLMAGARKPRPPTFPALGRTWDVDRAPPRSRIVSPEDGDKAAYIIVTRDAAATLVGRVKKLPKTNG